MHTVNRSSCTNVTIQNIHISMDSSDSQYCIDVAGNNILIIPRLVCGYA